MSSYRKQLKKEFKDKEYRDAYAEDYLHTKIASQIKVIREQRELTQKELAEMIGTKQPGVTRLENVNYASWNISTLKKIAAALGCWLNVSFEPFGTLLDEDESFSREWLQRPKFEEDPAFQDMATSAQAKVVKPVSAELQKMLKVEGLRHDKTDNVVDIAGKRAKRGAAGALTDDHTSTLAPVTKKERRRA